jgi:hypothetical protein
MAAKKSAVQTETLDVGAAEQAYSQLLPELQALEEHTLQPVRVELQLTAAIAYSVGVQGSVFDLALLDRLPFVALAAWHVRRKQVEALNAASTARVPEDTLKESQATRARMLRVLSYYFDEHPEYNKRISAIRAGTGYLDLANDLLSLADFYEIAEVKTLVSRDPLHYRADDPTYARQLAQQLFQCLGLTAEGDAARWTDLAQRAWTLLLRHYNALRAAGQLVFRNEEDVEVSYPSLIAAVRAPATRANAQPNPPAPEPSPQAGAATD